MCSYLQGGEIVQETITSNVSEDIITLEFQRTDGTLVTELIDFRNVSIEHVNRDGGISNQWTWKTIEIYRFDDESVQIVYLATR